MKSNNRKLAAIVLAAGKGKRMKSDLPKVLHQLAGKPLVAHVLDTLKTLSASPVVVVVGHKAEMVKNAIVDPGVDFVEQKELLGTGHAVMATESKLRDFDGDALVLAGDVPLLKVDTVEKLITEHRSQKAVATVLTAVVPDPSGYGRIVRGENGMILRIVEHKDASEEERAVKEINTGSFVFDSESLFAALKQVRNDNSQGEYYLTDVMQIFLEKGLPTAGYCAEDYRQTLGVNSQTELAELEALAREAKLS